MAVLSYDDMRRAAHEALAGLQGALSEVRGALHSMRAESARLSDAHHNRGAMTERSLGDLQQMLQRIETQLQVAASVAINIQQLQQTQYQFHQRLGNIEQLSSVMSTYLTEIHRHVSSLRQERLANGAGSR